MQRIALRTFTRDYLKLLPPPVEGMEIYRRDLPSFFIYPHKMKAISELVPEIAQELAQLLNLKQKPVQTPEPVVEVVPEIVPEPVVVEQPSQPPPEVPPVAVAPIHIPCMIEALMPWETDCKIGASPVMVASTADGDPMPDDWKEISLCAMHRKLLEQVGGYEVEDV